MFIKLKRVWSHSNMNYVPKFNETFPELSNLSSEQLCNRFAKIGVNYYSVNSTPVKPFIRLTILFAFVVFLLMIACLPLVFLLTGRWDYPEKGTLWIRNWFRALKLNV